MANAQTTSDEILRCARALIVRALVAQYRQEAEAGVAELERQVSDPLGQLRAYTGYWEACIMDATAPICVCALLASQIPVLPVDVAMEVRAHFRVVSAWLTSVLEARCRAGAVCGWPGRQKSEAEVFMAAVHGAMLSARAYGDPKMFGVVTRPLLQRLVP